MFWDKIKNFLNKDKISGNPLWNNLIVGKVLKAEKHPNADRLKVCMVDCGREQYEIVCGGVNVYDGMLTVVALPGAKVVRAGNDFAIEKAVIRGVASHGMLCGADEAGLLDKFPMKQPREIIDLTSFPVKPGMTVVEVLNKIVC